MRMHQERPILSQNSTNILGCVFSILNWLAGLFYYYFHNLPLFRIIIQGFAAVVILGTGIALLLEIQQREIDRGLRVATLHTQIAQVRAIGNERAVKLSLEALAREGASMSNINLYGAVLNNANLRKADLLQADLNTAKLRDANLREANLEEAKLFDAVLAYSDLQNANLFGADLREANLFNVNLRSADLRFAKLQNADLRRADMREGKLCEVNLFNTDLRWIDLMGADLHNANLYGARLMGAILTQANLKGTNLSQTDLSQTKGLTQYQLDEACALENEAPRLPRALHWNEKVCSVVRLTPVCPEANRRQHFPRGMSAPSHVHDDS